MRTVLSLIGITALSGTVALAQTQPAPRAPATPGSTAAAPLPGANSFTKGEAQSRIEKAGYSSVSRLAKDEQGIWRGTASKDGKSVKVSLDYKGNVTEN
ncbi:putative membrane protein [Rhizobiales bacterium GAS113]|nr:putative membrane protein [Rhizobiales bacterium GAS113]